MDFNFRSCVGLILLAIVAFVVLGLVVGVLGAILDAIGSFFDSIGFFGFWGLVGVGTIGYFLVKNSNSKNEGE